MSGIVDVYCTICCFCIIGGFRSGFAFDLNFEALACGLAVIAVSKSGVSQRKKDRNLTPLVGCMHLKSHQGRKTRGQDCQFLGPAPFLWNSYDFGGLTLAEQETSLPY
ncbi:hypothetical protein AAHA92_12586 [Salvia divinorum]|uniref:Uncharacterized protein n=1 Tax=Salvia divinorum TaxID=28513 RepID=A0ABD1HKS4_SALDI